MATYREVPPVKCVICGKIIERLKGVSASAYEKRKHCSAKANPNCRKTYLSRRSIGNTHRTGKFKEWRKVREAISEVHPVQRESDKTKLTTEQLRDSRALGWA